MAILTFVATFKE